MRGTCLPSKAPAIAGLPSRGGSTDRDSDPDSRRAATRTLEISPSPDERGPSRGRTRTVLRRGDSDGARIYIRSGIFAYLRIYRGSGRVYLRFARTQDIPLRSVHRRSAVSWQTGAHLGARDRRGGRSRPPGRERQKKIATPVSSSVECESFSFPFLKSSWLCQFFSLPPLHL